MSILTDFLKGKIFRQNEAKEVKTNEPLSFSPPAIFPSNQKFKSFLSRKALSSETLRNLAANFWVARACIDYRSSQLTALSWTVRDKKTYKPIEEAIEFFKRKENLSQMRFRTFLDKLIDDLLVIDAVAIYKKRNRSGKLIGLLPVDAATIQIKTYETGELPQPPETAYLQTVNGQVVAEMTTEDLIYDVMNPRTYTPYGFSPLESLVMQVAASLKADAYNYSFLSEGNVPEGFIMLPKEIASDPDKLAQWQKWFDLWLSGDERMMRKLRVLPSDSTYVATKKPTDMSFEGFQEWIVKATCAVYGVPPEAIGFTKDTNKATATTQFRISRDRGLYPLANFFSDIFNEIIEEELGFKNAEFWWSSLNVEDTLQEAQVADILVRLGIKNIDDVRLAHGQPALGAPNFIVTPQGVVLVDDLIEKKATTAEPVEPTIAASGIRAELFRWRRKAMADIKEGQPFRKFYSNIIPLDVRNRIETGLLKTKKAEDVFELFEQEIYNSFDS